jgi:hypothetical protein
MPRLNGIFNYLRKLLTKLPVSRWVTKLRAKKNSPQNKGEKSPKFQLKIGDKAPIRKIKIAAIKLKKATIASPPQIAKTSV